MDGLSGPWVPVAEVAEFAGKSPAWVRWICRSGAVGWKRAGARGWYLVDAADVEALMVVKSRSGGADAAEDAAGTEDLAKIA
jgi:hypothetical protein